MDNVKEKTKNHKVLKTVLICIIILLGLIAISGINNPHISPFSTQVQLSYPTSLAYSDQCGAIVDTQGKRLLITDEDDKLMKIVDTEKSGSPVDRINGATIYGDTIYAWGCQQYNKGVYLSSEKVITYNLKGEYKETLFEQAYGENEFVTNPRIKRLLVDGESIYVTTAKDKTVSILDLNKSDQPFCNVDFPEMITSAGYNKEKNNIYAIGKYMNVYRYSMNEGSIRSITYSDLIQEMSETLGIDLNSIVSEYITSCESYPVIVYNTDGMPQTLVLVSRTGDQNVIVANDGEVTEIIGSIACETGLFLYNVLFWLSVALLGLALVVFLIWFLKKKLTAKGRMIALVIGVIIFTAVFYTINDSNNTKEEYEHNMSTQAQQMATSLSAGLEIYNNISDTKENDLQEFFSNPENQAKIDYVDAFISKLCSKNGIENSLQTQVYICGKDGSMYATSGSSTTFSGERLVITDKMATEIKEKGECAVIRFSNLHETFDCAFAPIYGVNNEIVGVVAVSCYDGNVIYNCTQDAINLAVSLIAIFIGIYMVFSVCKTFSGDIKHMRKRDKKDQIGRSIDMAGILIFLNSFGYFLDSAIIVYVAQSLCVDIDPAQQAILVALPSAMAAAGSLVGNFLYTPLKRRLGDRTIAVIGAVFAIGSLLFISFSVQIVSIYLYILGKFIYGFANSGFLYVLCDTLPYSEKDPKKQKKAINSIAQSSGAAGILSCLVGGYVAEYLSYSLIYLLATGFIVAWLVVALIVFKNKKNKEKVVEIKKDKSFGKYWKIFLTGPMLMYIFFYALPEMLEGGYSSYLFPLYTASAGISALLLSNISVFAKALVYGCNDAIRSFAAKLNPNVALIAPMFAICIGLICFIISPNIYWAIAMMFAFKLLERMTYIGKKMYITDTAKESDLDSQLVQSNYFSISSGMYVFQSPILSAFVSLGMNVACAAVGMVSGTLFAVFGVYNKIRHNKKISDKVAE